MFTDVAGTMPEWAVTGGIAVASLVVVLCAFVVGARLFPDRPARTRRVSGEGKRRQEIRTYLERTGEAFTEDARLDALDGRVAFHLPARDVAVTFDARTYYRLEDTQTYPILVEHEMPGSQLGARLPFETPALDSESENPANAAFAILGVETGASAADLEAAYRERVLETHPDHGGDHDEFRRVREAYTTAKAYEDSSTAETS